MAETKAPSQDRPTTASPEQLTCTANAHLLPEEGRPNVFPSSVQWQSRGISTDSDTDPHPDQKQHFHSSHSPTPTPPHNPTFLQKLSRTWLFELLGLTVSAASLAAIAIVLSRYDGQRLPNWGPLSFNTLISILAVVSKMAALYGATSAVSQMKWVWFTEQDKYLVDYKTFDSGSRGLAGAVALAWSLKGRNAAVLGAVASIIGVAAGPFAQQIVHFYDAEYVEDVRAAWLTRSETLAALGPKLDSSTWTPDPVFKANAITALFLPTQETLFQPRFSCPTGNCTWAAFDTIGFCPNCIDISAQLNRTCIPINNETTVQGCTVAFPGDNEPLRLWYIADPDYPGSSTYMVVNSTDSTNATALTNLTWPGKIYQSIRAVVPPFELGGGQDPNEFNNGIHLLRNNTRFIGSECALSPCVRRLEASVSRGVYSEKVLDTFSEFSYEYPGPIILSPPWAEGKNFNLISEWLEAIAFAPGPNLFGGQMMGLVFTHDSNQAIRVSDIPAAGSPSKENDALQAIFYADFNGTTCPTPDDNVSCAFRALGAAMTKSVRDAGALKNGTTPPFVIEGRVHATGTFIRLEWPWFVLPIMVWVLSLAAVGAAMWKSLNVPLWRDSALPLVLLSGENSTAGGVGEDELSARAETVNVRLIGDTRRGLKMLTKQE